jgi:hypothetical protein
MEISRDKRKSDGRSECDVLETEWKREHLEVFMDTDNYGDDVL